MAMTEDIMDDKVLIEELKKENEELKLRLKEANAANAAKETFLSNMSHDIRTPMNAIIGMTALAKKYIDEKPRVTDALDKIDAAGTHLLSLINDILDMSRISSGRMELSFEKFSLPELVNDTVNLIRPMLEEKHHNGVLDPEDLETEFFYGDALRIKQVLVNVLSNAVKYTNDGGNILFTVKEDPAPSESNKRMLSFICSDDGMGMSKDFLDRIFEPFERVNNSTISGIEGTGLGMSIVKRLVDAMNGTIHIDSAVGTGTKVTITLPLEAADEPESESELKGKRLLIIERNERLKSKYENALKPLGLEYTIVDSAPTAIDAITESNFKKELYDIFIIGDERGPSDNIFETATYITRSYSGMTVVLVSTDDWQTIEYQAEKSGISGFIPVPFFKRSLLTGLTKALTRNNEGPGESSLPDLSGKRVLLVEDNMINREIAKEILSSTGCLIEIAENGKEAVDVFSSSPLRHFDIVLMDVQMPVMDGYEATKAIRALGREDSSVPIFAMTANTFAEDIAKAKTAGMDGHIPKPIDISVLMQTLKRALS